MSRLISPSKEASTAFLLAFVASLAIVFLAPSTVFGEGIPLEVSKEYSSNCEPGGDGSIIDPVGVLFRGTQASANNAAFETRRVAGWTYEGLGPQRLRVKLSNGKYGCRNVGVQPASEPDYRVKPVPSLNPLDSIEFPEHRYHVRLWFIPSSQNAEERKTVGTPHHEDWIDWNKGIGNHCKGVLDVEVLGIDLAGLGSHAVDKGGVGTGEDSGFDQGRQELRRSFENTRHNVKSEVWGNDERIEQCDEDKAGSNGNGIVIGMNWVKGGETDRPAARQSSALLRGRLLASEKSTDWWFEYGPASSEGASTYPNKTTVKSAAKATEVDVSQGVSGLSPNSTYYVRMFVRDEEGEIEEGNEVKFETCGWENADEDDMTKGPRAVTPECGGAVDTFYRDVNGDLGHQSWSAEGVWSTDTRPASIARSAIPQVIPRSDGSGGIDVFYRDIDGNLSHQWLVPGSGWQTETRAASMVSDPNVVTRPDSTIDVFYRTSGDELGHQWFVPGSGWSGETRSAVLSSDPHAVAHENGEMDVFYRSGTGLGRDHWAPEGGWSHEVRSGSLVAEPRPIAGEGGAVDVFYRTAEDELGHDWFVPGTGWSRETRSESLASDPHVVRRPDGTIDVFYRTSGDELGHDWWVSGTGWSTETRPGNMSSDPHVVARSDGSVEVFYRDGNRIGHQWYVPETGWSVETLRGPIASHTDPHVVTQGSGRIDVLYETPTEQLGRDWHAPGYGWAHEVRAMRRPSPPVAAYSFDEGEGTTVTDLTGNEHTATIHGASWTTHGRYGGALAFDAEEETYVSIPASSELDGNEELTVEAWVRPSEARYLGEIAMKEREGAGADYSWTLDQHLTEPAGYFMQTEEGMVAGGEGSLPLNTWTHVAMTDDGAHNRLYVNGQLLDTESAIPFDGHGKIQLGGNEIWSQWFDGRIDEVRIYDRALSEAELQADGVSPLQTPQKTPVAAYSFDEGEDEEGEEGEGKGETVEDLSGGGHTGTIEGAEWARGKYGGSLKFDGEAMVTIPASEDLNLTDEFTLEAWIKPEAEGEYGHLFVKEDAAEEQAAYVISKHESRLLARLGIPGVEEESPSETLELGSWQHVAATYDGGRVRLYVNGELVGNAPVAEILSTDGALRIGGGDLWWSDEGFKGRIDEVRVYNRALGAGEIAADKVTPLETPPEAPVAAYSFDEGEGTTVTDLTGNEHTATIHGASWTTHGRYGGALAFDAEEETYVSIPASSELDGNEELTVEAWVRPSEARYLGEIAMKEREGAGADYSWTLDQHLTEPAGYFMQTEEGMVAGGEGSLPLNTWTHVAMTDDGAHNRLYVNGQLLDTESAIPFDGHGKIQLGGNEIWSQWFDGRIDEVRIYDRALSEAELQADGVSPLQTPQKTPVAAYSFDEGEDEEGEEGEGKGETVEDLSGGGHTGTIEGAEWARGKYGGSLKFDGEAMVTIPASEDLNLTDEFTLEAWIKPEAEGEYGHLFVKEDAAEEQAAYVISKHESRLLARLGIPGVEEESPSETLELGSWQHVAATYDGGRVRLYVNGELVGNAPVAEILSTDGALRIGGGDLWWSDEGFKGRIDEVRVYNRALGAGEIAADKVTPLETPPEAPVAAYSFDEGEGTVAIDSAGEHDATIEGAGWAKGRYGGALEFDGVNDCAVALGGADLQFTQDGTFTIEAWVRPDEVAEYGPIITQEDEAAPEGEQPFAYTLLAGGEEEPAAWVREDSGGEGASVGIYGTEALPVGAWSHLALTNDGAKLRLYVDGVLQDTESSPPLTASEGPVTIGCNQIFGDYFDGRIDDVRIYDRALEAREVAVDR